MNKSEVAAIAIAVKLANKFGKAMYVKALGIGRGFAVSDTPGTFGCIRVVPTV